MKDLNKASYPTNDSKMLTSSTPRPVPNPLGKGDGMSMSKGGGKKSGIVKKSQGTY